MAFQDDLRRYLEGLLSDGQQAPRSWFNPDLRLHRQHLLRALERLEQAGTDAVRLARLHEQWSGRVDSFATQMGALLVNGLAHGDTPSKITDLINISLARRLELDTSTGSFIQDAELDRLSSEIDHETSVRAAEQYALEICAVRRRADRRHVTPLGRIALELPERDLIRWLLTAEALQSRGSSDEWRLSRSAATKLLKNPRYFIDDFGEGSTHPAAWATIKRLVEMGAVTVRDVKDAETGQPLGTEYEVSPSALPILDEIASGQDTPFSVLIAALLSDETNATLAPLRPPARQVAESAATATTRHARMVAHEIRNALVPVQGALDALYREGERRGSGSLFEGHRDAIDQGIDRMFRFIKEMMDVAERGAEPPDTFDLAVAIQDAIAAASSELGQEVAFAHAQALPPATGHRHRFTLAIVNLLRNAAQAVAGGPVEIRVSAELGEEGEGALVRVEDSGPGVPAQHRSAVFDLGFSLRPGGTGQGLALVREVVESEMGGRATCEDSPLGGARFVLKVPLTGSGAARNIAASARTAQAGAAGQAAALAEGGPKRQQ